MLKVRPFILFTINIFLMLLSWIFYKFPQGDEYLVIFSIPLLCMMAPHILSVRLIFVMLAANLAFFIFYLALGALNVIDIVVLFSLLAIITGGSFFAKVLLGYFNSYQEANVSEKKKEYNRIVDQLEEVDRNGRGIERELNRITRLYEVTKQLAPTLKFDELLDALFDLLEENFRFDVAHLLTFNKGEFSRGISKSIGAEDYYKERETTLDYSGVVDYIKKHSLRPVFVERQNEKRLFEGLNIRSGTFLAYPLFLGDTITAILAIEGASESSYERLRILIPQVVLELRKVGLYEQVQELSILDGLTEVYLRRYLMLRLEEEVDRAQRLDLTFSIAMIDIDHFKQCNDTYGHMVGDAVLRIIAERLKDSVREVDMISRYGGEEFCVILPETEKKLAVTVAERLRSSVESKNVKVFDENLKITISLGVATFPEDGDTIETLIDKADTALYKAKRKGRNLVCTA